MYTVFFFTSANSFLVNGFHRACHIFRTDLLTFGIDFLGRLLSMIGRLL